MTAPSRLTVDLGDRSYDIVIGAGLLADAEARLAPHVKRDRLFVVTEPTVAAHAGAALRRGLGAGRAIVQIETQGGESSKSFGGLERILDELLEAGLERDDLILALGGGVIGDLAGFAAAIAKRGCRFIQIPTTLLAQVDSSVGGKTAINVKAGKNLVGAFYQPSLVLIDTDTLATLPDREMRAGYAEIVKYALIDDPGFFDWLEANGARLLAREQDALIHGISVSCRAKAAIVAADETERGARALLNLGHTFGHAIEGVAGYGDAVRHGEAVAAGMAMAFRFSVASGLCPAADADRVAAHLAAHGLPTQLSDLPKLPFTAERLLGYMRQDKKNSGGRIRLILARGVGQSFIADAVDEAELLAFLKLETGETGAS